MNAIVKETATTTAPTTTGATLPPVQQSPIKPVNAKAPAAAPTAPQYADRKPVVMYINLSYVDKAGNKHRVPGFNNRGPLSISVTPGENELNDNIYRKFKERQAEIEAYEAAVEAGEEAGERPKDFKLEVVADIAENTQKTYDF